MNVEQHQTTAEQHRPSDPPADVGREYAWQAAIVYTHHRPLLFHVRSVTNSDWINNISVWMNTTASIRSQLYKRIIEHFFFNSFVSLFSLLFCQPYFSHDCSVNRTGALEYSTHKQPIPRIILDWKLTALKRGKSNFYWRVQVGIIDVSLVSSWSNLDRKL